MVVNSEETQGGLGLDHPAKMYGMPGGKPPVNPMTLTTDHIMIRMVRRKVVASFDASRVSSEAARLRGANEMFDVTGQLAAYFTNYRAEGVSSIRAERWSGSVFSVWPWAMRISPITTGFATTAPLRWARERDGRKHDRVISWRIRTRSCNPNRLELSDPDETERHRRKKIVADQEHLGRLLVDLFLDFHEVPPEEIVVDLDATNDLPHGSQEGRFFHGYWRRVAPGTLSFRRF